MPRLALRVPVAEVKFRLKTPPRSMILSDTTVPGVIPSAPKAVSAPCNSKTPLLIKMEPDPVVFKVVALADPPRTSVPRPSFANTATFPLAVDSEPESVVVTPKIPTLKDVVSAKLNEPLKVPLLTPPKLIVLLLNTGFPTDREPLSNSTVAPFPSVKVPVPRGPLVKVAVVPEASNKLVSPATFNPPENVLEPLNCSTPPPLTDKEPAFWMVAEIESVGVQGATLTPLV